MALLPAIFIKEKNLANAWQKAVVTLFEQGADIATAYDRPGDPPKIGRASCRERV